MASIDDETDYTDRVRSMSLSQPGRDAENTQVALYSQHRPHRQSGEMQADESIKRELRSPSKQMPLDQGTESAAHPSCEEMTIDPLAKHHADSPVEEIASRLGHKRHADSLFVQNDEPMNDDVDTRNVKRVKHQHDSNYFSLGDPMPESTMPPVEQNAPVADMIRFPATIKEDTDAQTAADQRRPPFAPYHSDFGRSAARLNDACSWFVERYEKLKNLGLNHDVVDYIVRNTLQEEKDPLGNLPRPPPVALLGSMGTGKSSGLNCYLDQTGVAAVSAGGRGTSIVHEYSGALPGQVAEYVVVTYYQPPHLLENLLEKNVFCIFKWRYQKPLEDEDLDEGEKQELRAKHDSAVKFFSTLFCGWEEFEIDQDGQDYFDERDSDWSEWEEVLDELKTFTYRLLESNGVTPETQMKTSRPAENEEELDNVIRTISGQSGGEDKQASIAPLIVKSEIHFTNDLLNAGVTLADAPGIDDADQTVAEKTKACLTNAGTIFVYGKPLRIEDSEDLHARLKMCMRLGKMSHTYLIITSIDQNPVPGKSERSALRQEDRKALEVAEDQVDRLKQQYESLEQAKAAFKGGLDHYREIESQKDETECLMKKAEMQVKQVAVEIRSAEIQHKVKHKFRELSGSNRAPDLKVIFTSNREYQNHRAGLDPKNPPMLDLEGTGIPKVQDVLYGIPAHGKTVKLRRSIEHVTSALQGIIGALTKSHLQRKSEVANEIGKSLKVLEQVVTSMTEVMDGAFKDRIQNTFYANEETWRKNANTKASIWAGYHASSYAAFCRKGGAWRDPKNVKMIMNWNHELQGIFAAGVNEAFNSFDDDSDSYRNATIINIGIAFGTLQEELKACDAFQGTDERPFFEQINRIKVDVISSLEGSSNDFTNQLHQIRNLTTLACQDNYVTAAMQHTYKKCAGWSAKDHPEAPPLEYVDKRNRPRTRTGVHAARAAEVSKALIGDGEMPPLFSAVFRQARVAFSEKLDAFGASWRAEISRASTEILHDFNARFEATEVKSEQDPELVEALKSAATIAVDTIQGPVTTLFKQSLAFEKEAGASSI